MHACLTDRAFDPGPPAGLDAFVAGGGTGWYPYAGLGGGAVADAAVACPLPEG